MISYKRKIEISLLDYYVQLNEQSINHWIGSDAEIGCESKWSSKDSSVVEHIINYLPKAGVHFHRTPGVFSESVAGGYRTRDRVDVEWRMQRDHFIVWLPIEDKALFYCPLARVSQMLSRGENGTSILRGESNLIDIELGDDSQSTACRRVLETTYSTYSLSYSNDLVKVTFETAPTHNVLYYDSYPGRL